MATATTEVDDFKTPAQIAEETGETIYRVKYAIKSRGIRHSRRVGQYRLYAPDAVEEIRAACVAIHAKTADRVMD